MKRITREDLEKMIYPNDYYYCSNHNCLPTTLKQCQECCNKALTEYENEIYNKALEDVRNLTFREVTYTDSLNDRTELRELIDELKKGIENDRI